MKSKTYNNPKASCDDLPDAEREAMHLQAVVQRITQSGTDITANYHEWVDLGFAFASLGESGRQPFHDISRMNAKYDHSDCDRKFSNCLVTGRNAVSIATFYKLAADHGIDTTLPEELKRKRGRKKMTEKERKQKAKEKSDNYNATLLSCCGKLRFNTWLHRSEMLHDDGVWRPIDNRDLATITTRMQATFEHTNMQQVRMWLNSRDVVEDYDPAQEYFKTLKPWNPDTDPDYIRQFFIDHLIFAKPEDKEYYYMVLSKWMVCCVALWLGKVHENPIMPIFTGPQHVGKTYFIMHILPPQLMHYLNCANPSARLEKDFSISMSENALVFIDEFSFGTNAKSDAYKYLVTSSITNERAAYDVYRERRERKAGLIGACNEKSFIHDKEGNRRYPAIEVTGTVNLHESPLPYEGAYAQAFYLAHSGYRFKPTKEESELITSHNREYMEPNDCEEAIATYYRKPNNDETGIAVTAASIQQHLAALGLRGKGYSVVEIGRALTHLGFCKYKINGHSKYLVVQKDFDTVKREGESEAHEIKVEKMENMTDNQNVESATDKWNAIDFDELYSNK